ncbi:holo-ACP synthase [Thalassotalea piscium]|uniref:Holo-[acyl-carrier-protein] synthase n=1 Tax=Thalassotalea piscium TaxID=1230533 RepID=A0A7X0NFU6_9GAMM|nr:holo-ACP synthase [Thalassotalea piscium]MBB6542692.1 holo-[acyl-carrier protein] synthase [Thalassotalea piscium]
MSIVGIGTDIIEISRIVNMSDKAKARLAKRVLTDNEYQRYLTLNLKDAFLAKRWAGKEATAKALGTGIAQGVSFQHIEISNLVSGKPTLLLTEQALLLAKEQGATQWHISLSDEATYATAFVVLSSD